MAFKIVTTNRGRFPAGMSPAASRVTLSSPKNSGTRFIIRKEVIQHLGWDADNTARVDVFVGAGSDYGRVLFRPTTSPTGRRVAQANKSSSTFNVYVPGKEIGVQKRFSMTVCDYVIVGNELYITVPSAVIAGRRQALSVAGE